MKKSIAILSLALLAGNAFAADKLEVGTVDAPKYYVIKANRGLSYVTYTADKKDNGGAETTLYRASGLSEAAVWAVVPGTVDGTINIYNYTTKDSEEKAYMFSFITKDGSEFVGGANSGTATTGSAQDVFTLDNGNGSYGLALKTQNGYNGGYWGLDATGGTSQFLGNWLSANDGGTQWWFYAVDDTNGIDAGIANVQATILKEPYLTSLVDYAAAVPFVANDLNAGIDALNKLEVSDDYQTQLAAIWDEYKKKADANLNTIFNGKTLAFKNLRRAANGKVRPFISVSETNYPMSETYTTDPNAIFTLESTVYGESTAAYYMYNAATQTYYGAGKAPVATKEEAAPISFMLNSNDGFTGVNIFANGASGNNAFNVDQNGNPLTYWSAADGGSIWSVIEFDVESALKDVVDGVKSTLNAYIPNVPTAVAEVLQAAVAEADALTYTADLAEKADAIINNAFAAANEILKNDLGGKNFALKALRNGYILVTEGEELVNAVSAEESDNTIYKFIKAEDGGYIIYSPVVEKYFGPLVQGTGETTISLVADAAEAIKVYPVLNKNGNFYGISLPFEDGGAQGLNANAKGLHGYSINDGGSIFSLAEKEEEQPDPNEEHETIINFNENSYGLTGTSSTSAEFVKDFYCTEGAVKVELDPAAGNGIRYWIQTNGTPQLRLFNNSKLTVSINKGQIKKVQVKGGSLNQCYIPKGFEKEEWPMPTNSNTTYLPSEDDPIDDYSSITFTAGGTVQFNQIIVTYTGGVNWPDLADPELQIVGGETEFTIDLGEEFTAPQITKATTAPITYTSSKPAVATVDVEGNVTIVGKGTTKITASVARTEEFKGGSVSYTLNVIKPLPEGTVFNSLMGTDFTFVNPEMPEVWKHDNSYGLKASGYESINWVAEAYAISPVITLPEELKATLYFEQAVNYLKSNPVADFLNVAVREVVEGETEAEWIVIENAVTAPEKDSWDFYANAPVDLTAFAGKTIQIGFKYNSTGAVACTWEIQEIIVTATDPLKEVKDAAIAEVMSYFNLLPGEPNPWMANGFKNTIEGCETAEEVAEAIDYCLGQIKDRVYAQMTFNFTWSQNDLFVTYTDNAFAGSADFSTAAIYNSERVNERSMRPWNLTEGEEAEEETRKSNDEDAIMIQNLKSGLYLALPANAGEAVTTVADKAQAGYIVVTLVDGKIALADDATGLYLALDAEKGLILSETPEMLTYGGLETFDKDSDYHVSVSFPGSYVGEWGMEYAHEVTSVQVAVTPGLKVSDIARIEIQGLDENWQTYTIDAFSAAALQSMTPEKGEGFTLQWNNETFTNDKVPFEADVYTLTLREKLTAPGVYSVFIAEGTFYTEIDGKPVFSEENDATINIEGEPTLCVPVVNPVEGKVEELETIAISGGDDLILNVNFSSTSDAVITLTSGTETIKSWTMDDVQAANVRDIDDFNAPDIYELKLDEKITANGTYVLTIPAAFFINVSENLNEEMTVTWTIEGGEDGISNITVNGNAATIFDLQGRRMNKASNGIFIINGKKVLVK